jgi:hypothetical protein
MRTPAVWCGEFPREAALPACESKTVGPALALRVHERSDAAPRRAALLARSLRP